MSGKSNYLEMNCKIKPQAKGTTHVMSHGLKPEYYHWLSFIEPED